jgi:hypothetical protein
VLIDEAELEKLVENEVAYEKWPKYYLAMQTAKQRAMGSASVHPDWL